MYILLEIDECFFCVNSFGLILKFWLLLPLLCSFCFTITITLHFAVGVFLMVMPTSNFGFKKSCFEAEIL